MMSALAAARHLLTVEEVVRGAELGAFEQGPKVELLDGGPYVVGTHTMPDPDVAVVFGDRREHRQLPNATSCRWAVEVSGTDCRSLRSLEGASPFNPCFWRVRSIGIHGQLGADQRLARRQVHRRERRSSIGGDVYRLRQRVRPFDRCQVSQPSRERDLERSLSHARAGIPVCWLVDLRSATLIELTEPAPSGYRQRRVYERTEKVRLPEDAGVIDLAEVFLA